MIKGAVLSLLALLLLGCQSMLADPQNSLAQRRHIALQLEQQKHLAEALTQWKIIALAAPDEQTDQHISQLEKTIQHQLALLHRQARATRLTDYQKQQINLKILALDPADKTAFIAMQDVRVKRAEDAANQKVANINRAYMDNQHKADLAIQDSHFTQQASDKLAKQDYQSLLDLAQQWLQLQPDNKDAKQYCFTALQQLGQRLVQQHKLEQGLTYWQRAEGFDLADKNQLSGQLMKLKQQLSNQYYTEAMAVLRSNIDQSVQLLQRSVSYNPANQRAAAQLHKARIMQQNLRRISSQ